MKDDHDNTVTLQPSFIVAHDAKATHKESSTISTNDENTNTFQSDVDLSHRDVLSNASAESLLSVSSQTVIFLKRGSLQ